MRYTELSALFFAALGLSGCGPGVTEGELYVELTDPECAIPSTGLGEECSAAPENTCRCNHVCGAEPFEENEAYLTHYCFAECNSQEEDPACPGATDICLPLGTVENIDACLPASELSWEWHAKIPPCGYLYGTQNDLDFVLGDVRHPVSWIWSYNPPEPEKDVLLSFTSDLDVDDNEWWIQIRIPKSDWQADTTLFVDEMFQSANATPGSIAVRTFSAELLRQQDERVWIEAIAYAGRLEIVKNGDTCESEEDCWSAEAEGWLWLSFAGFKTEIDVNKVPPLLLPTEIVPTSPTTNPGLVKGHQFLR